MLSGLFLVLALLTGVVWLVRRFMGHRFPGGRRGNAIRVLATRALGPRQGLLLAEAGGLVWLLAQGPDGVRLIAEIRDEAALLRLNGQYGFRDTPFESQLRRQMDVEAETAGPRPDREPTPEERLAALRRRPTRDEPT
jgi:flagellar biosynthetic protein FliO